MSTDNSNRAAKKHLRRVATAHLSSLRVLDCYAGNGAMWANVDKEKYLGIEKQKGKGNVADEIINADNLKIIPMLDLSEYNVIDLDAYGIPYDQMYEILDHEMLKRGTVVIYTAITNGMSSVNKNALQLIGCEEIYKKSPTLVKPFYIDAFYELIRLSGVNKVYELDQDFLKTGSYKKHYGYFIY